MIDEFLEKWKTDKKFKTKTKLLLYTLFVLIVSIYAISTNNQASDIPLDNEQNTIDKDNQEDDNQIENKPVINIPNEYHYEINIFIDDKQYKYSGTKRLEQTIIHKEINSTITNYMYKDNEYYNIDHQESVITTKEEVYDIVNYNYINLENINKYLEKGNKQGNQYIVYLKDIILGNDSEEYISILVNEEQTKIDYTSMMKYFNNDVEKYIVTIELEEIE